MYFSESKNKIGCITYSDTIRLSIKKRPTISAEFTPSKSAYCAGSLIILKAKGSFADSFGINVKGPFKTDTLISLSAKSGNTFTNVYSKSSNGCVSSAVKKSYVVADSSIKVIAVNGLNGTNDVYAMRLSNLFLGTDLLNEEEKFEIFYAKEADQVRFVSQFKMGVNFAFPDEVVKFILA